MTVATGAHDESFQPTLLGPSWMRKGGEQLFLVTPT